MAEHKDHYGNILAPEQVDAYWQGFIKGCSSFTKPETKIFNDETGFEKYLKSMGWRLLDHDYKTPYFSTYGTTARFYKLNGRLITVGLTYSGVKILCPKVVDLPPPINDNYYQTLKFLLDE